MIEVLYWVASSPADSSCQGLILRFKVKFWLVVLIVLLFLPKSEGEGLGECFGAMKGHGMLFQLFVNSDLNFVGWALDIPCHF